MPSLLITMLQSVLLLLVSVQNNTSTPILQRQQAISLATQSIQIVNQILQSSSSTPASTSSPATITVGATSTVIANNANGSPVRLIIPKLNVDAGFQYNGLKSDGTMEIPSNIYDVGWFTGSPKPGEKGDAIITGHVAQIRRGIMTKQGVFYNLSQLQPGDKLYVLNDKGKSITFVVRESQLYDPTADATDVFVSKDNGVHLNIITCEGTWNQAQLSYSQRLVVFTDAVQ